MRSGSSSDTHSPVHDRKILQAGKAHRLLHVSCQGHVWQIQDHSRDGRYGRQETWCIDGKIQANRHHPRAIGDRDGPSRVRANAHWLVYRKVKRGDASGARTLRSIRLSVRSRRVLAPGSA